jgi:hypothetical protein
LQIGTEFVIGNNYITCKLSTFTKTLFMKKIVFSVITIFITFAFLSGKKPFFSGQAPAGYSGVNGFTCNACHSSFAENSGGGAVTVTGLPLTGYTPGQVYPLSVTITHGAADRTRWGFVLKVVNAIGSPAGQFTSGASTAIISDQGSGDFSEIGHSPAATPGTGNSYTYTGFSWTAPAAPTVDDLNITFYAVGNAANFNGSTSGDYIYKATYAGITLPVILAGFSAAAVGDRQVLLQWQTTSESNSAYFAVERSYDGSSFTELGRQPAQGRSSTPTQYRFTDGSPLQFNKAIQYRLKMVDKDGRFEYSPIKTVLMDGNQVVLKNIAPNPATEGRPLWIEMAAPKKETLALQIVAANGTVAAQQTLTLQTGNNRIAIDAAARLQPGVYTVIITGSNISEKTRLVIQ